MSLKLGQIASAFKVCRFVTPGKPEEQEALIGVITDAGHVIDLGKARFETMTALINHDSPYETLGSLEVGNSRTYDLPDVKILCPIEAQKVWGAGVTYLKSRDEREAESGNPSFYYKVYEALRPELFPKADGDDGFYTRGPNELICVPSYSSITVSEPELVIVISSDGKIIGYTIGNDITATDIEGENPLYLPQAKTFEGCFSTGPYIVIGLSEEQIRQQEINLKIVRSTWWKVILPGGPPSREGIAVFRPSFLCAGKSSTSKRRASTKSFPTKRSAPSLRRSAPVSRANLTSANCATTK